MPKRALILVDIQNDFCLGGALAVAGGSEVVTPANKLAQEFAGAGDLVVATRDAHPANHGSFASQHEGVKVGKIVELAGLDQIAWPDHCVEGTYGAEFHPELNTELISRVFDKGTNPHVDSYSGFYDNDRSSSTGLAEYLHAQNIEEVWVCGLATDYCVKATAQDALTEGFRVTVVAWACRAVNVAPNDGVNALKTLKDKGCVIKY